MRRWIWIGLATASFACGGEDRSTIDDPSVSASRADTQGQHVGVARLSLRASDCPNDQAEAVFTQSGRVTIHEGSIEIGLENMPVLTGPLRDDNAEIAGVTTFMSSDEVVTCAVAGMAQLQSNLVTAQVSETLRSESALNCVQNWDVEISY